MFGKKPPTQSQSIGGNVSGSQIQQAQAGNDLAATQRGNSDDQTQGITTAEVLQLLEKLEKAVKESGLDEAQQDEVLDYLKPAKREAGKENANKSLVGENLKRVSEAMKNLNETSEAGKSLWQTGAGVFKAIAPWLGVAAHFFGL
ncbi:hypothetical protein [Leptolyngbya sp. NIES-2104]|uniref:hypothetical protein n=1 Tax=Leptolyngbya sp. NIES-2104 TaxID=1552121 RepID=UPI0006ECBFA3|nr:hypothetical protein [Leptolyngbya sp. NIES-2104]GAP99086.1 HEAT repeat [Leptolyngbya sp. NIES-2104]